VHILGQDDLFPTEGHQFRPDMPAKHTRTYQVSEDSPFNSTRPLQMIPKRAEDQVISRNAGPAAAQEFGMTKTEYRATKMPIDGEVRPINSRIVVEVMKKEREAQDRLKEDIRVAKMQDEAYWSNLEHDEGEETRKIGRKLVAKRRACQRDLAHNYQKQFAEQRNAAEEEARQERLEVAKVRRIEAEQAQAEIARQDRLRQMARDRAREGAARNDELMQRKERRIEADIAAEKLTQQQNAEVYMRMEAREQAEKGKRDAKTAARNKLIERQAKELAERLARQAQIEAVAHSEVLARQEQEHRAQQEKAADMRRQRNQDWLAGQRQRDMRMTDVKDVPDFDNRDNDALRKEEARWRTAKRMDVQRIQRNQMIERQEAEAEEIRERRAHPDTMFFLPDNEW
jgi:hypothetical protein